MVVCYWISETVWMSKDQLTSKLSISFVLVATHSLWLVTFRGYINSNVIKLFSPNISVISLPSSRSVEHLDPSDESPSPPTVDYSEKRSLPVTIPDHQQLQRSNEKFVVWLPRCGSSCIQLNQLAQLVWSYWTYFSRYSTFTWPADTCARVATVNSRDFILSSRKITLISCFPAYPASGRSRWATSNSILGGAVLSNILKKVTLLYFFR